MSNRYIATPGTGIDLSTWNPNDKSAIKGDKDEAEKEMVRLTKNLLELQEVLYAEHKHRILIVLQGMDTAGKDGTIRKVFEGLDPTGVHVVSFKVPTAVELDHDYLWRIHMNVPSKGEIVIFNRSHYEDVLVVRVHELDPEEVWQKRFDHINNFEHMLADEGTTIIKFYLHIDQEAQRERLLGRLDQPDKQWKFNLSDINERAFWPKYMEAYQDVLSRTSTEWAPWYIIPSNRKWYRDLMVSRIIVERLTELGMQYPQPDLDLEQFRTELTSE
jgi:PPK2 family polyphosphate:nucleotide phosphotransferase